MLKSGVLIFFYWAFFSTSVFAETTLPDVKHRLNMDEALQLPEYSHSTQSIEDVMNKKHLDHPALQIDIKKILNEDNKRVEQSADHYLSRTIQEVRRDALKNNLSLKIVAIDPKLSEVRVNEERAKFDNIIFASLKYGEYDLPQSSGEKVVFSSDNPLLNKQNVKLTLESERYKSISGDFGVKIPLRSGGTVILSSPFENKDKPDPFGSNEYQAGLRFSISQPLLRDAGVAVNEASINIADLDQQATSARARLQSIRIVALIDKAYWALNQAWTELEIRRQQHEYANQNLAMVQRRIKEGLSAAIELNRAEFGVSERIEQLIVAKTNLKLAQRQLKFLLNDGYMPLDEDAGVITSTTPTLLYFQFDKAKLLTRASANRLELLETELKLAEDTLRVDYLENQTLPLFTLDYSYGALSNSAHNINSAYGHTLNGDYSDWYVGFKFEMPVTNEARKARLSRAVEQRLQRLSTKTLQELTIKKEISDSLDVVDQHWQRILAARQQVGIAGMNYDAELKQFKEGLRTMTEVLEMLTRLGDAQIKEIRAITDYQTALIDLCFATGTLLGYSNINFLDAELRTN